MKLVLKVIPAIAALALAACSSTPKEDPTAAGLDSSPSATSAEEEAAQNAEGSKPSVDVALETVYFDFDSYVLNSGSRDVLTKVADSLKTAGTSRLQIEGHCDERGSNEYNLALGEKRARAVEEYLIGLGVSQDLLSTISYGEERPSVEGSSEEAWAKNRRAQFTGL